MSLIFYWIALLYTPYLLILICRQLMRKRSLSKQYQLPKSNYQFEEDRQRHQRIYLTLENLATKRKRLCLQIMKQYYLFSSSEESSSFKTVGSYDDRLLISDESLHAMFKKLETKAMESKIWGFLNLKFLRLRECVQRLHTRIVRIQTRTKRQFINTGFYNIKIFTYYKRLQQIKIEESKKIEEKKRTPSRSKNKVIDFVSSPRCKIMQIKKNEVNEAYNPNTQKPQKEKRGRTKSITKIEVEIETLKKILHNGQEVRLMKPTIVHVTKQRENSPNSSIITFSPVKSNNRESTLTFNRSAFPSNQDDIGSEYRKPKIIDLRKANRKRSLSNNQSKGRDQRFPSEVNHGQYSGYIRSQENLTLRQRYHDHGSFQNDCNLCQECGTKRQEGIRSQKPVSSGYLKHLDSLY